ncbi:hypothetical protein [Lysobacter fragariae]
MVTSTANALSSPRGNAWHWILVGGVVLATLDLCYVLPFSLLTRDIPPIRVLQYIASGALGKASFDGGWGTAALGVGFHYFIATLYVFAYYLASGRLRALLQRPLPTGIAYGLLIWLVMNYVVLPLSLVQSSAKPYLPAVVTNFAMHLVFGVICVWAARKAHRADS